VVSLSNHEQNTLRQAQGERSESKTSRLCKKSNGSSEAIHRVETITGKTVKLIILRAMKTNNIKTLVFSSSATVYGDPIELPLTEDHPLRTTNPYG